MTSGLNSADSVTKREAARRPDGRFGAQEHDESEGGINALRQPPVNPVQLDELTDANKTEALRDLAGRDGDGAEYARRAIVQGHALGARALLARDEGGRVRGAMALLEYEEDIDSVPEYDLYILPGYLIDNPGSTMPGCNRAMLRRAMEMAVDKEISLYLEPTSEAREYWERQGATEDPDDCGIAFSGYSLEMMMERLADKDWQ